MAKTIKPKVIGVELVNLCGARKSFPDFKARLQQSAEAKRKLLQATKKASKRAKGDLSMKALHEAFGAPEAQEECE